MGRFVIGVLILCTLATTNIAAQDLVSSSPPQESPTPDGKLLTLMSLSYASAIYDTQTTLTTLRKCPGQCYEANPLMRPFVKHSAAAYAYSMSLTSLSAYGSYRLKKSGSRWWWVPLATTTALHAVAAIHNQRLTR